MKKKQMVTVKLLREFVKTSIMENQFGGYDDRPLTVGELRSKLTHLDDSALVAVAAKSELRFATQNDIREDILDAVMHDGSADVSDLDPSTPVVIIMTSD